MNFAYRRGRFTAGWAVTAASIVIIVMAVGSGPFHMQEAYAIPPFEQFQHIDRVVKIHNGTLDALSFGSNDAFGASVDVIGDVDGDGTPDIMVGANGDDSYAEDAGAAYILFMNRDGTPRHAEKITGATPNGPSLSAGDYFGVSVAGIGDLDGDGIPDVVVGADGGDAAITNGGALHVLFLNADGTVKHTAEINGSTPNGPSTDLHDYFGFRVTDAGDIDGDGITDIAVGKFKAHGSYLFLNLPFEALDNIDEVTEANQDEMFYGSMDIILMNRDGTPKDTIRIDHESQNVPYLAPGAVFGSSVAGIGDFDGDGTPDLLVGSEATDHIRVVSCPNSRSYATTVTNAGSVHILLMNPDGTVKGAHTIDGMTPNGPSLNTWDFFGIAASEFGDIDGDGVTDLVGGSNLGDGGGKDRGHAHVMFMNADGTVKRTQIVSDLAPNGPVLTDYDYFGFAISSSSDFDGDGRPDIVMGAYLDNSAPDDVGGATTDAPAPEGQSSLGAIYVIFTG